MTGHGRRQRRRAASAPRPRASSRRQARASRSAPGSADPRGAVGSLAGDGHFAHDLDVTDGESAHAFVAAAAEAFDGRIDILVNNAGLAIGRDDRRGERRGRRGHVETNVLGLVRMTRLCLPHMEDRRGHVVNLGSWAGREAYPGGGMYVGSKYAVRALTAVMRKDSSRASA